MSEPQEPQFDGEVMKVPVGAAASPKNSESKSPAFGLIIALLFLTLVLILGGLVLWYRDILTAPVTISSTAVPPVSDDHSPDQGDTSRTAPLPPLSTSTEIDAIATDIESTIPTSTEPDIAAIDTEIDTLNSVTDPAPVGSIPITP